MATRGEAVIQTHRQVRQDAPAVEAPEVRPPPELGVLDRRHLRERRQRRQARALVSISVLGVALALVLAAVGHAVVASDQIRSDALQSKVSKQLAVAQNLQLQRAELEAPVRIESIAENQLYMVTPASTSYLVPVKTGETVAAAHQNPKSSSLTAPAALRSSGRTGGSPTHSARSSRRSSAP